YRKALKSRLSPPCGKAAGAFVHHTNLADAENDPRKLVCYDCGVACDLSAMKSERLVYLSRLGAKSPRPPAPPRVPPPALTRTRTDDDLEGPPPPPPLRSAEGGRHPEGALIKKKGPKPPPRIVQGEPRRYRFVYAKVGPMAFLSHLDLIRALPRSF